MNGHQRKPNYRTVVKMGIGVHHGLTGCKFFCGNRKWMYHVLNWIILKKWWHNALFSRGHHPNQGLWQQLHAYYLSQIYGNPKIQYRCKWCLTAYSQDLLACCIQRVSIEHQNHSVKARNKINFVIKKQWDVIGHLFWEIWTVVH